MLGAMVRLTRTVRFAINPPGAPTRAGEGFCGRPGLSGFGALYELEVSITGEVGTKTGYLMDIKAIDALAREQCVPILERHAHTRPTEDPALAMPEAFDALARAMPLTLERLVLRLSPMHAIEVNAMTIKRNAALMCLSYDFAASHRLHVAELTDEENRRLFGKCNWENGHGHNYQFEVRIEVPVHEATPQITPAQVDGVCRELILQRYDHRHLNLDCEEFGEGGVNPTVENIARVFYERLAPAIERLGGRLHEVLVRESDRTSATYPVHAPI